MYWSITLEYIGILLLVKINTSPSNVKWIVTQKSLIWLGSAKNNP